MLEAVDITYSIRGKRLVDGVSLDVKPGEVVVVAGPNGAGKSTLLKTLAGDIRATSGEVRVDGRGLDRWRSRDLARRRAVLPQSSSLAFPFRVLDIVLIGRGPHLERAENARDVRIARDALEAAGVRHLEDRTYTTLSGGERQRVHLARVMAQIWEVREGEPCYLLLDEPTASLDLAHQHVALGAAESVARAGGGVLVVLHDLNLAARYADRIGLLADGRLVAIGTPAEVIEPSLIERVFAAPVLVTSHPTDGGPLVIACAPKRSTHEHDSRTYARW